MKLLYMQRVLPHVGNLSQCMVYLSVLIGYLSMDGPLLQLGAKKKEGMVTTRNMIVTMIKILIMSSETEMCHETSSVDVPGRLRDLISHIEAAGPSLD